MNLKFWKKQEEPAPQAGTITVTKDASGLLTLKVSGVISPQAIADDQSKLLAIGSQGGRLRGLVDAEEFQGWTRGFNGGMTEVEKMFSIDEMTDRMAVVADARMHEKLKLFLCVWMRSAPVKFFELKDRAAAMSWLQSQGA